MLLQFRKITHGFVATAIFGLIGVATVLFLIPRNGLQPSLGQGIARVGDVDITPAQLSRELDTTLERLRNNGQNVTREEAIDQGIHIRLLDNLISRQAFYQYAVRQGVDASDAEVARQLREIPTFQNQISGAFDNAALDQFLAQRHYTRAEFLEQVRGGIANGMLMDTLVSGMRPPASFGALAVVYESENRVLTIAQARSTILGAIPPPTDAQLHTFYDQNHDVFQLPEYRALTLVYARPADFAARVNITDAQLHDEFNARRDALSQPEKRSYTRIIARSQEQADTIAQRVSRGENAAAVARSLGLEATQRQNETRVQVTDGAVAAAVFSLAPGSAPRVVRGQLSPFVVVQVQSVTPAVAPTFESLRDQIRQELATAQARELIDRATNGFDEARGGGMAVAQAAQQAGLTVVTIPAADAQGRDPNGQPIAPLSGERNQLLSTANQTPEGEASDFMPTPDGDVVVAVDHVTPAALRPFDSVRDQIQAALITRERVRRMQALADEVKQAVRGGQSFAAAARARHLTIAATSQPLNRQQAQQLPPRLAAGIFNAAEGEVVSEISSTGENVLVAVVEHINRIDPAQAAQQVEAVRRQAQNPMTSGLANAISAEVTAQSGARKNTALIERTFRGSSAAASGEDQAQ